MGSCDYDVPDYTVMAAETHRSSALIRNNSIALVALDLDGTLMGSDLQISARVVRAIRAVQQQDVTVTLATGRMFSATLPFARYLGISTPLICYQGGWIQAADSEILHRDVLPQSVAQSAVALAHEHQWHTVVYVNGKIIIEALRYPKTFYDQLLGPDAMINPDLESVLQSHCADKILFVAEPEAIPAIARYLIPHCAGKAEVVQSHNLFIEIVPKSVNKGRALAWLAARLHIPQQAVLAIGDQENDVPMLTWAGVGIAMGNAIPAARQVADWTAPTLAEDGAAVALERFILDGSVP
ncbi:MAG: Cof-type HAD-IIB family hydrolase [Anaerolineae bacterium]|nr:Cof-type HAD-IIB family hydrolase [Anaerolineae bacterium]